MDSIRVPILLLAALTLMFAVLLVHRLLGTWAAVALAVLLATDPVYGAVSRADWGPIVLSALLRMSALLCYFGFPPPALSALLVVARRGAVARAASTSWTMGWFIGALMIAALVTHHRELLEIARRRKAVRHFPPRGCSR